MILDTIVEKKKEEVEQLRRTGIVLPDQFRDKEIAPPRRFTDGLTGYDGVSIIAEAKKASPSKGVISPNFDPVAIARNYEKCGAQAVSVLTDVDFFQGQLLYLMQVREAIELPVIRKDFIIDSLQVQEARDHGADAILLIAAILDLHQLRDLRQEAEEYGLDVLTEVHDEQELELTLESGAALVGINNRNLKDFSMDLNTTFRLNKLIPEGIPVVSESGLKSSEDIKSLAEAGITAALIGESLMRAGSSGTLLNELRT
jgi:indole-3-glycerol phosphate synthase